MDDKDKVRTNRKIEIVGEKMRLLIQQDSGSKKVNISQESIEGKQNLVLLSLTRNFTRELGKALLEFADIDTNFEEE
jgi:SpoU rRNA methylase family enzyme